MAILSKCNASDLVLRDELTLTLPKEKGLELTRGLEAFVWVSEDPRQGPKGTGLEMRGEVTSWELTARGWSTATIHSAQRLSDGLRMNALAQINSKAAGKLHCRIHRMRHCRIWGLSAAEREVLKEAFDVDGARRMHRARS